MLISWGDIFSMAGLTAIITLVIILLLRLWLKELSLAYCVALALVAGGGFVLWFAIFNIFSLDVLNQDWPIPFFPVSPEDLGCALVVGILAIIFDYGSRQNKFFEEKMWQPRLFASIIAVVIALVIDVYFI